MKRWMAWLVAALLLPGISALAEVQKTELVYARLSAGGELEDLYVVNAFEATQAEAHEDHGDYSEWTQLSPTLQVKEADGKFSLQLPQGRSYYQGKPARQELPWEVRIRYSLDGAEVAPDALSGAEGLLGISLSVKVRESLAVFAKGATLQISLRLDGDRCLDIQSQHATFAQAGGDILLTFMLLPGQSGEFEVSAQVRDFSMEGLQLSGVRMAMDAEQYKQAMAGDMENNPLAQAIGPMVENFVRQLEGEAPGSFVDSRNGVIKGLQFILLAEGIQPPPQPAPEEGASQPEQGFWSRLASLFDGK